MGFRMTLTHNINKFGGLPRDWVGGKILFMCFLGSFLMREKTHKQSPPKNPGPIPWKISLCVFSLVVFVGSQLRQVSVLPPRSKSQCYPLLKRHCLLINPCTTGGHWTSPTCWGSDGMAPKQAKHRFWLIFGYTVQVKKIAGSLVIIENLFAQNYRYRLEFRMNSLNYHCRYRLGVHSHPFISIDSQLPSWKSFELIFQDYRCRYRLERFFELERW